MHHYHAKLFSFMHNSANYTVATKLQHFPTLNSPPLQNILIFIHKPTPSKNPRKFQHFSASIYLQRWLFQLLFTLKNCSLTLSSSYLFSILHTTSTPVLYAIHLKNWNSAPHNVLGYIFLCMASYNRLTHR